MQTGANNDELREKITLKALERQQLNDATHLAGELKRMLVKFHDCLQEEGFATEIARLEDWIETQRHGAAPAHVINVGAMTWLKQLRERLKLSADELHRLRDEGGNACGVEQNDRTEDLLQAVRCIDQLLDEKSHIAN